MVENEKHLVCPIIILCHCSVYFSKKSLTFVLCTLFFFTNSWVLLSVFECLHISFFSLNHTFITTCCSSWTHPGFWEVQWFFLFFFFLLLSGGCFFVLFFVVRSDLVQWDFCSACCFCHCASSSGWPNRPKLSKSSSFGFFFYI